MGIVGIARDPFARVDIVREAVPATDRRPCGWCGNGPGRFRYGFQPDSISGRINWCGPHTFCCVSCWRAFYNIEAR